MGDGEVAASSVVLGDADLLFLIASLLDDSTSVDRIVPLSIRALTLTSSVWRAVVLRADLPLWRHCDSSHFRMLEPHDGQRVSLYALIRQLSLSDVDRWTSDAVLRLLHAKPLLQSLDLTQCAIASRDAADRLIAALPMTLHTFVTGAAVHHPDAMLHAVLKGERLAQLPHLTSLDISGVCTERTLAGLRMLARQSAGGQAVDALAPSLPALECLSVGFHTFTALGVREGAQFLIAAYERSPRLCRLGCALAAKSMPTAIDVACAVCGGCLWRALREYAVHPPQQPHITYELHTSQPPVACTVRAMDNDETRLQCVRDCQPGLWIIDVGSGHVQHVVERKYAVACGDARAGHPPLVFATRAAPLGAWGLRSAEEDCFVRCYSPTSV